MSVPAIPLREFDHEMGPHEKSFALGHLAQLISSMPGWIATTLRQPHIDLAAAGGASWSLRHGDRVLLTGPRGEIVRGHLNHLIHHRGQLSVHLRLVDVPLPQIYGPTADEPWG
jgi:hypothetical protein